MTTLRKMGIQDFESLDEMNALPPPEIVRYRMEGKYFRVVR
jgi:hypothetical protein